LRKRGFARKRQYSICFDVGWDLTEFYWGFTGSSCQNDVLARVPPDVELGESRISAPIDNAIAIICSKDDGMMGVLIRYL
jgi:hypothetical protein